MTLNTNFGLSLLSKSNSSATKKSQSSMTSGAWHAGESQDTRSMKILPQCAGSEAYFWIRLESVGASICSAAHKTALMSDTRIACFGSIGSQEVVLFFFEWDKLKANQIGMKHFMGLWLKVT